MLFMLISLCKAAREREAKIIFSAINGFSHVVFITPTGMCAELLHVYFVSFHSLSHSTEYNVKHLSSTLVKTTIAAIPPHHEAIMESQNEIFQSTFFLFSFFVCVCRKRASTKDRPEVAPLAQLNSKRNFQ